jgi:hypothetical protein
VPFFSFSKAKKFNRLCHFWVLWYFLSIEILDVSVYIIIGFDSHIYTCYIGQWCITQLYFSLFNFALSLWILSFFLQWLRLFSFSPWWCVALDKNLSLSLSNLSIIHSDSLTSCLFFIGFLFLSFPFTPGNQLDMLVFLPDTGPPMLPYPQCIVTIPFLISIFRRLDVSYIAWNFDTVLFFLLSPFVCLFVSKKDFVYVFRACLLSLSLCLCLFCVSFSLPDILHFLWEMFDFYPRAPLLFTIQETKQKNKQILINISSAFRCGCKSCNTTALISPAEMLCVLWFVFFLGVYFSFFGSETNKTTKGYQSRWPSLSSRLFRYHLCCIKFVFSPFSF